MSTLNTDTVSVSPDVELALGVKDRFGWTLFTDWCAAADRTALPAEPVTLAQFIAENSAALLTQRRRISTVNAVHRAAGHPEPGRADTIRRMVNTSRSDRLSILETVVAQIIPRLPVFGWTGGLFGRRDALLLLLASSGLSFEQISAVHRNNIRFDRDIVVVDGVHPVRLDPDTYHAKISPADVYRRWAQIPEFLDRTPSTRLLAEHLDAHTLPVNAHLAGTSPPHHPRPQRPRRPDTPDYEPEVFRDIDLDDNYYESGLEARRTAHAALTDVTAALAHVEDRADEILRKLLAVLDTEP